MVEELLEGEPLPLEICCSSIVKCDMNKTREEKKGESREREVEEQHRTRVAETRPKYTVFSGRMRVRVCLSKEKKVSRVKDGRGMRRRR